MEHKIKLVAIDLDGTLLDKFRSMPKENYHAIQKLIDNNYKVLIATGADLTRTTGIINSLKLPHKNLFCLCYNGAIIYSFEKQAIIHQTVFSIEQTKTLFAEAEKYNIEVWGYPAAEAEIIYTGRRRRFLIWCFKILSSYQTIYFDPEKPIRLVKALTKGSAKNMALFLKAVKSKTHCNSFLSRILNSNIFLHELVSQNVDKSIGLEWVVNHYNLQAENVLAIGDGMNDIGMLKYAGHSVAMQNAYDEVKAVADDITDTNKRAGVAKVLDKLIFSNCD